MTVDKATNWQMRFWAVFGGQTLSLVGSALTQFVLLWWIADTTGSVSALATAGMAAMLPQALLGPLGGALADRHSRRMLMIVADLVSAACMLVLIWLFVSGRITLWHAYIMMAVRSAMQALQAPAASASVSMLVPSSFLTRAAGLNQAMQSMTLIVAAPLGAFAISVMPIGWALGIDVATALLGIVPLLVWSIPQPRRGGDSAGAEKTTLWRDLRDGVHLVWSEPGLRRLYCLIGVVVMIIMPAFTLVPLLVKQHFHGGATQVGLMEGLSGAGMLFGGVLVAAMVPRRHVQWILFGFAASCLSISLTALVPTRLFGVGVAWWVIGGITYVFGSAPLTALLQSMVPHHLQGRVLALLNSVMGLAAPVGLAFTGPLGEAFGIRGLFAGMGILGALACLAGFASPALLRLAAERAIIKDTPHGEQAVPHRHTGPHESQ